MRELSGVGVIYDGVSMSRLSENGVRGGLEGQKIRAPRFIS